MVVEGDVVWLVVDVGVWVVPWLVVGVVVWPVGLVGLVRLVVARVVVVRVVTKVLLVVAKAACFLVVFPVPASLITSEALVRLVRGRLVVRLVDELLSSAWADVWLGVPLVISEGCEVVFCDVVALIRPGSTSVWLA